MKSKIRDIVDGCPYPSPIKCTVGASCGECKTLAILALIAADRAGLVEALPYVEPSPKDTVCNYPASCGGKRTPDACDREKCDAFQPQPEPMPQDIEWIRASVWKCPKCGKLSVADYKAHDQQVRKDFAKKIVGELKIVDPHNEETRCRDTSKEMQLAADIAHIRAMAEKE